MITKVCTTCPIAKAFSFAMSAAAMCLVLLALFTYEASAQCYTTCPLITITNCQNTPARVTALICCDNSSQPEYSETFTVPAGACGNNSYVIGFLPCYVTGMFIISSPSSATYTWNPATCTLTIN